MYSYGSPHTAAQKQDDQHERTFSSYVRIQVVVLKTYLGRWTIGRSGERGSGISVLPARYDDDDINTYIYIYIYVGNIYVYINCSTAVNGDLKAPFSIVTTRNRGWRYSFPCIAPLTLDLYLNMLSDKQGSIKYHFLSLWYDSTWNWTYVSQAISSI